MIQIDRGAELTPGLVGQIINKHRLTDRPRLLRCREYYDGKHDILKKAYSDPTKPCARVVVNYPLDIVREYGGYLTGFPISYNSKNDISSIMDILKYNDAKSQDAAFLRNALIYGRAYELYYIDEDGQQRFAQLDPIDSIPVYSNTIDGDLLAFVRIYPADTITEAENTRYIVEVYDADSMTEYSCGGEFIALTQTGRAPHHYGQVPVTVFQINEDGRSIFEPVVGLVDAYEELLSAESDDYSAFVDSYLVVTGVDMDVEDVQSMRENRVLQLPSENAGAQYLTKSQQDAQIQNMLTGIEQKIREISQSPNFSDASFGVSSGIALRFRLLGFENAASDIADRMVKALQKRLELLSHVLSLSGSDTVWRDVEIVISRNIPKDMAEIANMVNPLRGLVSDKTLLSQIPFVSDPDAEIEAVKEQNLASMAAYGFEHENGEEPGDEEQEDSGGKD